MGKILNFLILYLIGGFTYFLMECIWRGYSHWSMFVLGGLVFILIGEINEYFTFGIPLLKQCLLSAIIITIMEFIAGSIINLWLNWNVWDYSDKPFNLLGQICPQMFGIWILVSCFGIILDDVLRWKLFGEEKPRYILI